MSRFLDGLSSGTATSLHIACEQKGSAAVFTCRGSFSLATYASLDELVRLIRLEPANRIVLDMRGVKHIDSVGVGTLAMILRHTMATSRTLVIVCDKIVRDVLTTSSLDLAFRFAPSVDAAL